LQNVIKHSRASEVTLGIRIAHESFAVEVADNGCGFASDPAGHGCDGIHNMKSRLGRVGGTCEISNRIPVGTTVSISLPLHS